MPTQRHQSREKIIIDESLTDLRNRVRLLLWAWGMSWTVLVLLGGLLGIGILDWWIHFDDPGLRLILGISLFTASCVVLWTRLIRPLRQPLGATFLASRIEHRFPNLQSRVVSAVEFLENRLDSNAGSPELQRVVVERAIRDLEQIEPRDIAGSQAVWGVTVAGSLLLLIVSTVAIFHPVEAATTVKRLLFPLAKIPWPRRFDLRLVHPDLSPLTLNSEKPLRIARGEALEVYVVNDRGPLPDRVWYEHRVGTQKELIRELLRPTTIRDDQGTPHQAAVLHWIATEGPLHFRATGGDDDSMSFVHLEVVPPPTFTMLEVRIEPPKYAGRRVERLPPGVGHVRGLLGTSVHVSARADKPLKSASLRIGEKSAVRLALADDRQSFNATFTLGDPGADVYWLELIDEDGFTDRETPHYELFGVVDQIPQVVIESPVSDILLTSDAELSIKMLAKDDLGLKDMRLVYQINAATPANVVPLLTATVDPSSVTFLAPVDVWNLAEWQLPLGSRIVFRAEATDDYDLGPEKHLGQSTTRTIVIVSKEDKLKELAHQMARLLDELKSAAGLQQRATQQTSELQTQLDKTGELRVQDIDQLQRIELDQKQAAARLLNPIDSVQSQAQQLRDAFRANRIDDSATESRLDLFVAELSRLGHDQFPDIDLALTRATKQAEEAAGLAAQPENGVTTADPVIPLQAKPPDEPIANPRVDKKEVSVPQVQGLNSGLEFASVPHHAPQSPLAQSLNDAQTRQRQAVRSLQELEEMFADWRDRRDVSRELRSVISDQEQVQRQSVELGQQTLTKSELDLSAQEKADLGKLAAKQRKIADQVEQFLKQLDHAAKNLRPRDADTAERLEEARDELLKAGTAGDLREAATDIGDNKFGAASQVQQQAIQQLKELDRQLEQKPTDDLERLVKQVDQAMQDFGTLHQEQAELVDATQQAASHQEATDQRESIDEWRQRQQEIGEKLRQAERKLQRLQLRQPSEAASRATQRVEKIEEQLQTLEQTDDAVEEMQEVVDDIDQVERDLALEKRIAQERLAVEQLEKVEDALQSLLTRQQVVVTETERLEAERLARGSLSRGQLKSLRDLAVTERKLQTEVDGLQSTLSVTAVLSLVLRRASKNLERAADRLQEKQTDLPTLALERAAARAIESLVLVLKQKELGKTPDSRQTPNSAERPPDDDPQEPEKASPPGEVLSQISQLKMLKMLQEEFLERTRQLQGLRDDTGTLAPETVSELARLAEEQDEVARLTRDLVAKISQNRPESDKPPTGDNRQDNDKPDNRRNE